MTPFRWAIEQLGSEKLYNIDDLVFYTLKHERFELEGISD